MSRIVPRPMSRLPIGRCARSDGNAAATLELAAQPVNATPGAEFREARTGDGGDGAGQNKTRDQQGQLSRVSYARRTSGRGSGARIVQPRNARAQTLVPATVQGHRSARPCTLSSHDFAAPGKNIVGTAGIRRLGVSVGASAVFPIPPRAGRTSFASRGIAVAVAGDGLEL
jgi:hypothetical protein